MVADPPTFRTKANAEALHLSLSFLSLSLSRARLVGLVGSSASSSFSCGGVCCQDGVAGFTGGSGEGNQEVKSEMASEPRDNEDDEDA